MKDLDQDDIPRNPLLRWGAYAGATIAIMAAISGAWAIMGNDTPPLASINRVEQIDTKHNVAENQADTRLNTLLGAVNAQSIVMLQIQLRACQHDREAAAADLRHSPESAAAQEALSEASDCVRSLSRQITRPQ